MSTTWTPGADRSTARASAGVTGSSNSTFTASPWPTNTGTRTQVACTLMSGSRILRVSTAIFHSSLVAPSSMKRSICGMTLKAIGLVNSCAVGWSPTKVPRLCTHSSSMPSLPAPETDW